MITIKVLLEIPNAINVPLVKQITQLTQNVNVKMIIILKTMDTVNVTVCTYIL